MIYLISGNGRGAGKTTLATRMVGRDHVFSHADSLRMELHAKYPRLSWFALDQITKDEPQETLGGRSMRDILLKHGQDKCSIHGANHWAERLVTRLQTRFASLALDKCPVAVDDLRKITELDTLLSSLGHDKIIHFHIMFPAAVAEPEFDGAELARRADYIVSRKDVTS